jgi:hypothetical protein
MKPIKFYCFLFFTVLVLGGCDTDKGEFFLQEEAKNPELSFPEFINSKVNVEAYLQESENNEQKPIKVSKNSENPTASFDEDFFELFCSNLDLEDFEEGRIPENLGGLLRGPLTENASVGKFKPGEITAGLKVSSEPDNVLALFGLNYKGSDSKVILTNRLEDVLVLEFPENDVSSLDFDVYSFPYTEDSTLETTIQVIYKSGEEFFDTIKASVLGVYFSLNSAELISKIKISSPNLDGFVGVDNIQFGICEDMDGDGCLNEDDTYQYSINESTVKIGSCDSQVENRLTSSCGVYMSDFIDDLVHSEFKNKGQFVKSVASTLNEWEASGLITSEEKEVIQSCAAQFDF